MFSLAWNKRPRNISNSLQKVSAMGNFNVTEYLQYYRSIATLHPSINGFYTMDINEVLGDLRSGMKYPALILNSVNGFLSRNLSADNTQNLVKAGFMVIDHVDSVDDFQKEMQILGDTFDTCIDILTKLMKDAQCGTFIRKLDVDSIKYEMLGPVFDNDFGFMFTFDLRFFISDLSYKPDRWLSEPKEIMAGFQG